MKCPDAQKALREALENNQRSGTDKCFQHLSDCDLCRHYYSDLLLGDKLKSMQIPEPSTDFVENCIARAVTAQKVSIGIPANLWSMVAMLLIGIMLGVMFASHQPAFDAPSAFSHPLAMVANKTKLINVVIDSDEYQSNATIIITLADNVEIEGYPDTRELSWQTELLKGKNLLALPLILHGGSEGYFEISYTASEGTQRVRVDIATKPDKNSQEMSGA